MPALLAAPLAIARKDLRQRLRDRSALILCLLAPLLVSGLMAMAFARTAVRADVGVVDLDRGPAAQGLVRVLESPQLAGTVHLRAYPDRRAARAAVSGKDVDAAVIVPAGFTTALSKGGTPPPVTVLDDVDQPIAALITRSVTESYVAQVNADRLSVRTALASGAPPERTAALVAKAAALRLPERVRAQGLSDDPLKAISYFAPGMGLFFVLFMVSFGARGYFTEQDQGTLDRIAAAPVGRGALLVGKSLSTFVYSVASLATIMLVSWLAFGARWADPVGVGLLCLALGVLVVCLTALVTVLARTERQADGLAYIMVFVLSLLGGNFVYAGAAPETLRHLALFTPNGWALRGFTDLATGVGGWSAVAAPLLAVLAFSLGLAALTALLLRLRRTA
ncbi:ABC transporter permease [Streptomyces sp. NPDC003077]|uniref:ABC transporter permease n=1 Tax=Streptomyces sp. NPDC003077 TaxID=3154443 RepID=UPI0033B16916